MGWTLEQERRYAHAAGLGEGIARGLNMARRDSLYPLIPTVQYHKRIVNIIESDLPSSAKATAILDLWTS